MSAHLLERPPYDVPLHAVCAVPPADAPPATCLDPAGVIDSGHPEVLAQAAALVEGAATSWERARRLFGWVRDAVAYDFSPDLRVSDDWRASETLRRGRGFCQQKAILLCALGRAAGIPSALGYQHIRDHMLVGTRFERWLPDGIIHWHGLTWLWLPTPEGPRWCPADATLDATLCARRGYRLVAFEESQPDAGRLPETTLAGAPHFDVLAEVAPFAAQPEAITALLLSRVDLWSTLAEAARRDGVTM